MAKDGDGTVDGDRANIRESELHQKSSLIVSNEYKLPIPSNDGVLGVHSDVVRSLPSSKTILAYQQQNVTSYVSQGTPLSPFISSEAVLPSASLPASVTSVSQISPTSTHEFKDLGTTNTSITEQTETAQEHLSINTEILANPNPAPLNIAKASDPHTPPSPSGKADISEMKSTLSTPKQRNHSGVFGSSGSFSTVELSSSGRSGTGATAVNTPLGVWSSSPPDIFAKVEESPESKQSLFLGQSPQGALSESQPGQVEQGISIGETDQDLGEISSDTRPRTSSDNKPSGKEVSNRPSVHTEQLPVETHHRRETQSSPPVGRPSRQTFIEEANGLNLDLLWEGECIPAGKHAVDSNAPQHKAPVLGDTPPKSTGPTQKEIEAKEWFRDLEARGREVTPGDKSVERSEETKRLEEHVKALRNAGTQKVQCHTHC